MGERHRPPIIHQRIEITVEDQALECRPVAALRRVVIRAPFRIIGPDAVKSRRKQWVSRADAGVECADGWSIVLRRSDASGELIPTLRYFDSPGL